MKNDNNLDYALHNEKTCKYLDKRPEFTDWVITTAFYSALHFVRYKLFPLSLEINGKEIKVNDFEKYFKINNPMKLSKHSLLSDLVEEHHPKIASAYNKLRDISWTARYNNYKYPREISNDAKKKLETIKTYCTSK